MIKHSLSMLPFPVISLGRKQVAESFVAYLLTSLNTTAVTGPTLQSAGRKHPSLLKYLSAVHQIIKKKESVIHFVDTDRCGTYISSDVSSLRSPSAVFYSSSIVYFLLTAKGETNVPDL